MRFWPFAACAMVAIACSDTSAEPPAASSSTSSGGGSGGSGGAPMRCGSADGMLDGSLLELAHEMDTPVTHLREQTFAVTTTQEWALNDHPVHEAVRFELEGPARIHGFKVKWAALPAGAEPTREIEAGLYADFGYNGFDFWAPDPLWTGTRCVEDIDDTGAVWTTYAFETPIEIDHPGLVYVAHRAEPGAPVWWFDDVIEGDPANPCAGFDDCQSSLNLPEADTNQFYNGLSFPFQYHYSVRLLIEPAGNSSAPVFAPHAGSPSGQHASWADYDNDGDDDLLLGNKLYNNDGGTFVEAPLPAVPATGGVFGDYDNDGCLDLFLFVESPSDSDTLLHNECDGSFTVAANTGIVDQQSYEACTDPVNNTASPTASAAWIDIDADGYIDLYLANFICWASESYYRDTVFRNNGDGTFSEISGTNGFGSARRASRTLGPIDHDRDGDVDIAVGNYRLQANQFFDNDGDGTVTERAAELGLAGRSSGLYYGHTIGLAWGDLDNDGDFDQIAANLAHPRFFHFSSKTEILLNDGSGHYVDNAGDWAPNSPAGLRYQETHSVPVLLDADSNGDLDLAITAVYDGRPTDFYWGNGDGTFTIAPSGITTENGWGIAGSDYDNDGDVDLFATTLFDNLADQGHFLSVKVVGVTANRAAIGATVAVTTGATTRLRHVPGASGKGGQDSLYLHFGLGAATSVDSITVAFPGGNTVTYPGPIAVDQRVWLVEDSTTPLPGWSDPT